MRGYHPFAYKHSREAVMPAIFETVMISADIESVFDLISRIEEFPLYADALKEVRKIGDDTYRFVAQGGGITLEWDSVVTEFKRPTRLAWRSIRGVANSGAYTLAASPAGTLVSISLQFSFPSRLVEALTAPLVIPLRVPRQLGFWLASSSGWRRASMALMSKREPPRGSSNSISRRKGDIRRSMFETERLSHSVIPDAPI
jgi:hypothetical protein